MLFNQGLMLLHKRFEPIVCYSQCTPAHAAFFGVMMSAGRSYVALHSINEHLLPKLQYFGLWPLMPKAKNKESYAGMPYSMATFQGLNKKTPSNCQGKVDKLCFFFLTGQVQGCRATLRLLWLPQNRVFQEFLIQKLIQVSKIYLFR